MLKFASDPCNLDRISGDENFYDTINDASLNQSKIHNGSSLSCNNIASDLKERLNKRKKLIHSAKMKFLGMEHEMEHDSLCVEKNSFINEKSSSSPICALISEIRETINEIVSPERSKFTQVPVYNGLDSLRWIERPKFEPKGRKKLAESEEKNSKIEKVSSCVSLYKVSKQNDSLFVESLSDFKKDFQMLENFSDVEGPSEEGVNVYNGDKSEAEAEKLTKFERADDAPKDKENIIKSILNEILKKVSVSEDDEATYTVTDDSLLPTYSYIETTETEWYYSKTIMELENSQTVLEIKETEQQMDGQIMRHTDTGIDTDFTSEKENVEKSDESGDNKATEEKNSNVAEEPETEAILGECSILNKSSETDSSFLKSSSGQTSNDVDTSFAFKTETDYSEKINGKTKSPKKNSPEEQNVKESNSLMQLNESIRTTNEDAKTEDLDGIDKFKKLEINQCRLPDIPESPEFTNIDTEDAPVTSSSKNTSPEVINENHFIEEKIIGKHDENEGDFVEKTDVKSKEKPGKKKRKKNKKSSTKITVKKEFKENDAEKPVVSEIKLTIKNSKDYQSEKYEVKIQDVTNTSEELSSSMGEHESFDVSDNGNAGNCDCEAQQNLEELQGEVSTTIEKLQTIEDYFENELMKHSNGGEKPSPDDEFTIVYNYGEFEDVANESKGVLKKLNSEKSEMEIFSPESYWEIINGAFRYLPLSGISISDYGDCNVEFSHSDVSTTYANDLFENVSIFEEHLLSASSSIRDVEYENSEENVFFSHGKYCNDLQVEHHRVLENVFYLPNEITNIPSNWSFECFIQNGIFRNDDKNGMEFENKMGIKNENVLTIMNFTKPEILNKMVCVSSMSVVDDVGIKISFPVNFPIVLHGDELQNLNSMTTRENTFEEYINKIFHRLIFPSKAITWYDTSVEVLEEVDGRKNTGGENCQRSESLVDLIEGVIRDIINKVPLKKLEDYRITDASSNVEDPSMDTISEFDNIISCTNSIIMDIIDSMESQAEESGCESFADEECDGFEKETKGNSSTKMSTSKISNPVFKVVIATPSKKEIFINYSNDSSSTFDLSSDFDFSGSYIKTDDVNEDFENFSSDNSGFFSADSSADVNSLNSSYGSLVDPGQIPPGKDQFFYVGGHDTGDAKKSPKSLSVIQELDEGGEEESTSSDVVSSMATT